MNSKNRQPDIGWRMRVIRWREQVAPLLLGLLVGVFLYLQNPAKTIGPNALPGLLGALISFSAIIAGFLATITTIIMSVNSPALVRLRQSAHYSRFLRTIWSAVRIQFALTACTLATFCIYSTVSVTLLRIWLTALGALAALALANGYHSISVAHGLFRAISEQDKQRKH